MNEPQRDIPTWKLITTVIRLSAAVPDIFVAPVLQLVRLCLVKSEDRVYNRIWV